MRRSTRGFTLIEVLVVVSIIALLVAILLPSLKNARRLAQASACASNLHQMGLAFQMYAQTSRGWLPAAKTHDYWDHPDMWSNDQVDRDSWGHRLVDSRSLVGTRQGHGYGNWHQRVVMPYFECPSRPPTMGDGRTIPSDQWGYNPSYEILGFTPYPYDKRMSRLDELKFSDRTILLTETMRGAPNYYPFFLDPSGSDWNSGLGWDVVHGRRSNFLMIDGHVSRYLYTKHPARTWWEVWCFLDDWEPAVQRLYWRRADLGLERNWPAQTPDTVYR